MLQRHKLKSILLVLILILTATSNAPAATITVNHAGDVNGGNNCNLRQALLSASFNLALSGCNAGDDNIVDDVVIDVAGPIILTQGQIDIFGSVAIYTSGNNVVRVEATPNSRIFRVNSTESNDNYFSMNRLSLTDGDAGSGNGGALLIEDAGEVRVINSWFIDNLAENGGAIYGNGATVSEMTLSNNHFISNGANIAGGALYGQNLVASGLLDINRNTFKDNFAEFGGAIYLNDGGDTISFFVNKFTGNIATDSGAGVYLSGLAGGQTYDMDSNLFYKNQAVNLGGAIRLFLSTARLNMINTTLSHNYAAYGGAVSNGSGNLQISTSTLVYNFAQIAGANLHSTAQGINAIEHSIVAHPKNQTNCGSSSASFNSFGANVVDDNSCGFNQSSDTLGDPLLTGLVVLQDTYAYYPTVYSPALDNSQQVQGLCLDSASAPIPVDQFGSPRNMDGDGDGTGQCDAGAIEAFEHTDLLFYDGFGVDD